MKPTSWRDLLVPCWTYYQEHAAGGSLHIVLDDGNLEDRNVDFCIKDAAEHGDEAGLALARSIRAASYTQRQKLYDHYDWYCFGAAHPDDKDAPRGPMARMRRMVFLVHGLQPVGIITNLQDPDDSRKA